MTTKFPKSRGSRSSAVRRASGRRSHEKPLAFYDAKWIPYGGYSAQRPGDIAYGVSLVYPRLLAEHHRRSSWHSH